jgi:uncharacterized protein (TIGR00369 family)
MTRTTDMTTTTTPPDNDLTEALHSAMPFAAHLDIVAVSADTEQVTTSAHWQPHYCGIGGVLHGGYLMALADANGATLAFLNLAPGASTTTVESKTNFFRPVTAGSFTATSTMVHKGRTTMVVQTDITNADGSLICRTAQTQIIRPAEGHAAATAP